MDQKFHYPTWLWRLWKRAFFLKLSLRLVHQYYTWYTDIFFGRTKFDMFGLPDQTVWVSPAIATLNLPVCQQLNMFGKESLGSLVVPWLGFVWPWSDHGQECHDISYLTVKWLSYLILDLLSISWNFTSRYLDHLNCKSSS